MINQELAEPSKKLAEDTSRLQPADGDTDEEFDPNRLVLSNAKYLLNLYLALSWISSVSPSFKISQFQYRLYILLYLPWFCHLNYLSAKCAMWAKLTQGRTVTEVQNASYIVSFCKSCVAACRFV